MRVGGLEILLVLMAIVIYAAVWMVPFWFIYRKAGLPPALSLLMIIPIANFVMLYILAFGDWPALKQKQG
jgi:branched-subunit amino acid transport protein AzlD